MSQILLKHEIIENHNAFYSIDGVVCIFDAIMNAGCHSQHLDSSNVWTDLVRGIKATSETPVSFTANAFVRQLPNDEIFLANVPEFIGSWTVEVCVTPFPEAFSNYRGVCGGYSGRKGGMNALIMVQYENGHYRIGTYNDGSPSSSKNFAIGGFDRPNAWPLQSQIMTADSVSTLSLVVDKDCLTATAFRNGVQVGIPETLTESNCTWTQKVLQIGAGDCSTSALRGQRGFIGKIHCIRVYEKALTATELANNVNIDEKRFGY